MRFLLLSSFCIFVSIDLLAQQSVFRSESINLKGYASTKTKVSNPQNNVLADTQKQAQTPKKHFAPTNIDIYVLPLFGKYDKTEAQIAKDITFLKDCDLNFKTRKEASTFFSTRAWEYLSEGQKDTAICRFNLAYLLDDENADAYWGLGVVAYQDEKLNDAVDLMQLGMEKDEEENVMLMVDLATVYIKSFTVDNNKATLQKAIDLLRNTLLKQTECVPAHMQLALAQLLNEQTNEAWESFHKGYEIEASNANPEILEALLEKSADPKGIFQKKN